METKSHLSTAHDLQDAHLLPGQFDPMNADYVLSPAFVLSTKTVSDDIRPMVHINDHVRNMEAMLVVSIAERNLSFSMIGKYFLLHSLIFF